MTNKTERWFVCSESELVHLKSAAWGYGFSIGADHGDVEEQQAYKVEAEAACRARPVESIGGGMWQDEDYTGEHK